MAVRFFNKLLCYLTSPVVLSFYYFSTKEIILLLQLYIGVFCEQRMFERDLMI